VDDDVRGPRWIETIKHGDAAPQRLHAIHHRRRNFDFMHAHLLYARASPRWVQLSRRKAIFRRFFRAAQNWSLRETSFRRQEGPQGLGLSERLWPDFAAVTPEIILWQPLRRVAKRPSKRGAVC